MLGRKKLQEIVDKAFEQIPHKNTTVNNLKDAIEKRLALERIKKTEKKLRLRCITAAQTN